jgi:hypothetical protein
MSSQRRPCSRQHSQHHAARLTASAPRSVQAHKPNYAGCRVQDCFHPGCGRSERRLTASATGQKAPHQLRQVAARAWRLRRQLLELSATCLHSIV